MKIVRNLAGYAPRLPKYCSRARATHLRDYHQPSRHRNEERKRVCEVFAALHGLLADDMIAGSLRPKRHRALFRTPDLVHEAPGSESALYYGVLHSSSEAVCEAYRRSRLPEVWESASPEDRARIVLSQWNPYPLTIATKAFRFDQRAVNFESLFSIKDDPKRFPLQKAHRMK